MSAGLTTIAPNPDVDVDRIKHDYDYAGNRTWRAKVVANTNCRNRTCYYSHDDRRRLPDTEHGDLTEAPPTGTQSGTKGFAQSWPLEDIGNWGPFTEDDAGKGTSDLN